MKPDDTICAVSSPAGVGGIGVIRMSGPAARDILKTIFRPKKAVRGLVSHRLYLGFVFDPDTRQDVDEVFAVFMKAPRTYTREPVAEVYSHGGIAAQRAVLRLMTRCGARLAEAGEFTKRAFLNGRIDLAQAESVLDIVESESESELACALMHAKGLLSARIHAFAREVLAVLAEVEAEIDFPDEGLDTGSETRIGRLTALCADLDRLISSYDEGRVLRQGHQVLIVGRTNVGKSSLLNALAGRDRAIVTAIPGTTRDLVEDTIHIRGVKFTVTDTAGLRAPADAIEKEGMERLIRRIPETDTILWVLDASEAYTPEDEEVSRTVSDRPVITVLNKADLPARIDEGLIPAAAGGRVRASALTGEGLDELRETLYAAFEARGPRPHGLIITSVRQAEALARARQALGRARECAGRQDGLALSAFELKEALSSVGSVTGEACAEEVLDEIFKRFCVGK